VSEANEKNFFEKGCRKFDSGAGTPDRWGGVEPQRASEASKAQNFGRVAGSGRRRFGFAHGYAIGKRF